VFVDFNHLKSECFKQLLVIDLPKERRDKIPRKKMKREREKVKERCWRFELVGVGEKVKVTAGC
jgi:hypothetical protein